MSGERHGGQAAGDGHDRGRRPAAEVVDERGHEPDRAEDVGGDDLLGRGEEPVGGGPVLGAHHPGHGDEDVEVGVGGEHLGGGGRDAGGVGGVDLHALQAVLGGEGLQQGGAPPADDDGVPGGLQPQGEGEPDAAGGAGDEDGASGDVHAARLRRGGPRRQRPADRGTGSPWSPRPPWRSMAGMDRPGLAAFLRSRREALVPADVGLPPGARRRAPACGGRRSPR